MIIASLSEPRQVAFYGIGDKVNTVLTLLCAVLCQAALPVVSKRLSGDDKDWSLSLKLIAAVTAATACLAVGSLFLVGPFISWFFSTSYTDAIVVAQWFCVVSVFMVIQMSIANLIIVPGGKAKVLIITSAIALSVSLAIQVSLVPTMGAAGAVVARAASEACSAFFLAIVAIRLIWTFDQEDRRAI